MSAIPANVITRAANAIVAERAARRGVVETLASVPEGRRQAAFRDAAVALYAAGFGELLEALRLISATNTHHGSGHHCTCSQKQRDEIAYGTIDKVQRP